jgi:hypothetical protein
VNRRQRLLGTLLAAVLALGSCASPGASPSTTAGPETEGPSGPAPTPPGLEAASAPPAPSIPTTADPTTANPTASPTTANEPPPPSVGEGALLYHLEFASDIIDGIPQDAGNVFPPGTPGILALLGWDHAAAGTEFRLRLYLGDRLVFEDARTVIEEDASGVVFGIFGDGALPKGHYTAELSYNGVPEEMSAFDIASSARPESVGEISGADQPAAAIPYADPSTVLVVTRVAVLRAKLGAAADRVLARAAEVGDLHDLEADGVRRADPAKAVKEVQRLLRARSYRYLLILGNDDAVPFARVENPLAASESDALVDWELPADWLPSDDPYADLDGDPYGVPDLAVARIPSSEDPDLLLTQLGEIVPPPAGGFALVNQRRRTQASSVIDAMDDAVRVETRFAPPTDPGRFRSSDAADARYLYILLHGIGVTTDAWLADVFAWSPYDPNDLAGNWKVEADGQADAVNLASARNRGVVDVGACYGAWTLDTVQEPKHKTADNSLALAFLRSGTRAFVADTHLSYSIATAPDGPYFGRTGFEVVFWQAIAAGSTPIDAFQQAKVTIAATIDLAVAAGAADAALLNLKTLHEMVYLGRP